jgi:hypothetical protein
MSAYLPQLVSSSFWNFAVDGDAYVRADDGADAAAGTLLIRLMQFGRVIAFAIEDRFVEGNNLLGADQNAQVTALTALLVNDDGPFEHTTPLNMNKF